jgi:hypothetical protein
MYITTLVSYFQLGYRGTGLKGQTALENYTISLGKSFLVQKNLCQAAAN